MKYLLIIILLLSGFSCSSKQFKQSDRWEGIKKGNLRVYVRDRMEDIFDDKNFDKKAADKLKKLSNDRAVHLLISYIRANVKNRSKYKVFNNRILEIIKYIKIKYRYCEDDYCEAFADYQVKNLINDIQKVPGSEKPEVKHVNQMETGGEKVKLNRGKGE